MKVVNSKLIKDYMKKNDLSRRQLAEKCGVSLYAINSLCAGEGKVRIGVLVKISVATGIKTNDIVMY